MSDHAQDEAERLRQSADSDAADSSRAPGGAAAGAACVAAQTKTVSVYPTSAAAYYACQTIAVTGTETEGGSGTTTADGDTLYAYNLGSAIPASGTKVLLTRVAWRWVFRHDG